MGEFKQTALQAGVVLGNLQKSADSLKEMVRYEVDRALGGVKGELEVLREKVRVLEGGVESETGEESIKETVEEREGGEMEVDSPGDVEPASTVQVGDAHSAPEGQIRGEVDKVAEEVKPAEEIEMEKESVKGKSAKGKDR
jgi:hypothetical protein